MSNFRVPRKIKKSLRRKLWLYPADEKGNSLMVHPTRSQKDLTAVKQGIVKDLMGRRTAKERREENALLDKEVTVSDEQLKTFVEEIFAKEYRNSSYNTLLEAKENPIAIKAYYNFVNAYRLTEKGEDSYGNICCMAVDLAADLLRKEKKRKAEKKKRRRKGSK